MFRILQSTAISPPNRYQHHHQHSRIHHTHPSLLASSPLCCKSSKTSIHITHAFRTVLDAFHIDPQPMR